MAKSENSRPNSNIPPYAKVHPSNDPEVDLSSYSLEKFRLYETRQRFYLIGSDRNKKLFRVLKIDRSEPSDLNISEDPVVYSPKEIKNLLQRIDEGNRATGGLTPVAKVFGIAGCIKFMESYYLILVTKRRQIGWICGHAIYSIDESQLITIPHVSVQTDVAHSKTELRYKKLLSSVDLTKDFFYSYTYPIMQSLQKNVLSMGDEGMPYDNIFVWNAYLTQAIRSRCNNTIWTIALVHGHFKQMRLSIFGRDFGVSLVSRRSRHFAGTRYLKRGVNDRGRVANDVETEQIVIDEEVGSSKGRMSSVVQMRGSIPLFWSQEASRFSPKPDIILQRYDPTYEATRLHFEDLASRYGNPVIVLNLIKTVEKRPREMMLRREFANAVGYLNQILSEENHLKFIHWDFHKFAKSKSANVLAVLGGVASEALDLTGFYYSGKPAIAKRRGNKISRTSTGRDASLRDLRANSGDLARIGSSNENLISLVNRDRETDLNLQNGKENSVGEAPRFQSGVLRTNCIDCLDRTNVAQYAYGLAALGRQLHAMGLTDVPKVYMFQALVCDGIFIHKSSCGQGTKAWPVIEPNIHKQLLRKIDLLLSMTEFGGKQMLHGRVIMEDHESHDNDDIRSSASSLDEDSRSSSGSTSSSDMVDDASSSTSYSSSSHSRGPLYELSELMAQLPIKRGLSKYFEGKSQSFTSLTRLMSIEDLAKKERPYRRKMKTCKSYGGGLDAHKPYTLPKATISKKAARGSLSSLSFPSRRGSFLGISRPPPIPLQKNF